MRDLTNVPKSTTEKSAGGRERAVMSSRGAVPKGNRGRLLSAEKNFTQTSPAECPPPRDAEPLASSAERQMGSVQALPEAAVGSLSQDPSREHHTTCASIPRLVDIRTVCPSRVL